MISTPIPAKVSEFLPTPSARRATVGGRVLVQSVVISTHALREEGDVTRGRFCFVLGYFYPRPPRGGRPPYHAARGQVQNFYPRPPRGGRLLMPQSPPLKTKFLPTPSARRATRRQSLTVSRAYDFYPRPPRGGRQRSNASRGYYPSFLPTPSARRATRRIDKISGIKEFLPTPSARRATETMIPIIQQILFLPTPSARRATAAGHDDGAEAQISTHALREEGDPSIMGIRRVTPNFYPRPPRGGRPGPERR